MSPPSIALSTLVGSTSAPNGENLQPPPVHPRSNDLHPQPSPLLSPGSDAAASCHQTSILSEFEVSEADIRDRAWKHVGYRVYSRLIASDPAFFVLRKFGTLNARVALALQDGIASLEEELNELDEFNRGPAVHEQFNNASFRREQDDRRRQIVQDELPNKLAQYSSFINGYAQLVNRSPVRPDDVKTLRTWFGNYNGAIDPCEAAYICQTPPSDLISIQSKSRSWFRRVLESTFASQLRIFQREPFQCHCECENDRTSADIETGAPACDYHIFKEYKNMQHNLTWQHDNRLETFSTGVVAVVGLGMLIGPIWWLAYVSDVEKRLGVITGFITLFFTLLKVATNSHVFESLAATAAYGAVLMVFIQIGSNI